MGELKVLSKIIINDIFQVNVCISPWSVSTPFRSTFEFVHKGPFINDVTKFWTIFENPFPHRHAFYYEALILLAENR